MSPKHKKVRQAVAFDQAERRRHASLGTPELTPDQLSTSTIIIPCTVSLSDAESRIGHISHITMVCN
jgi:hypothetical protein